MNTIGLNKLKELRFIQCITLVFMISLLSSCSSLEPEEEVFASLQVENNFPVLRLRNNGQSSLRYFAIEDRSARRVDMLFEPEKFPKLHPGERAAISIRGVLGYTEDASMIRVFWVPEGNWDEGNHIWVEL